MIMIDIYGSNIELYLKNNETKYEYKQNETKLIEKKLKKIKLNNKFQSAKNIFKKFRLKITFDVLIS